jgi:hypothetical protein
LQFAKEDKINSCNFYFFFRYKTLAIHGDLDYKDFLLCSPLLQEGNKKRFKRGVQAKREREGE